MAKSFNFHSHQNPMNVSLHEDCTDSLKGSYAPPPVESAHQRQKVCPKSRVTPRLEEPNVIGGNRFLFLSFSLIDR